MKKITILAVLLFSFGFAYGLAQAGSLSIINPQHPQIVTGAFTDLKGHTDAGGAVALLTIAGNPYLVPLDLGGSLGRALGGPSVAIGASMNLAPAVQVAISLGLLSLFPDPAKFANLKSLFMPATTGTPDVSFSLGPHYSYVFDNGLKGRGMWTLFYGAAWTF
jgi:hypothetical protein